MGQKEKGEGKERGKKLWKVEREEGIGEMTKEETKEGEEDRKKGDGNGGMRFLLWTSFER